MDQITFQNTLSRLIPGKRVNKATQSQIPFASQNIKLKTLTTDKVSFGKIDPLETAERKITNYVKGLLVMADIKKGQEIKITTTKENMPFAKIMSREAYKMGSGNVSVKVIDPELDKYKGEKFDYQIAREKLAKEKGQAELDLGETVSAYKDAGLAQRETDAVRKVYFTEVPEDTRKLLESLVDPKEVLIGKLGLKPGQPIMIQAQREHEPLVLKLAQYAHDVLGSKTVEVYYSEGNPNDFGRNMLENASEDVVMQIPELTKERFQEYIDKKMARLILRGPDPFLMAGVSKEKMALQSKAGAAFSKEVKFYSQDASRQWCIYYAPTTKSAIVSYPEYKKGEVATKEEELAALKHAAKDAFEINRVGKSEAHFANLKRVADLLNTKKFDKIHFFRQDPATGKVLTDLYIGMAPKDKFESAEEKTIPNKPGEEPIRFVANCPTEEVFASPDCMKVSGFVTATLPLSLQGKIIKDLYVEFDNDGKIILDKIAASENRDVFYNHVKDYPGADRLGEVALVADSPIFKTGRLFLDTLLDENAACHIAIGRGFPNCIEGASDISDREKLEAYLKENHCNISDTHVDFMIGSPEMLVEGIKIADDGQTTTTTLIKDNKFQI